MPMNELVGLLTNMSKRGLYDKHFEKGAVVAEMPLDTRVTHTVLKKVMVVGPRDFYVIQKCQQVATNVTVIASQSIEADKSDESLTAQTPAVEEGVVRAHRHLGGFLIR